VTYLDAIFLGILQGLTEFLPISSSGHLVLAQSILSVKQPGVSFELLVHLGTLFAVFIYFRNRILSLIKAVFDSSMKPERAVIGFLVIGTIPAGLAGLLLEDIFEEAFSSPAVTSAMLLLTGVLLLVTRFVPKGDGKVTLPKAIAMGIGQALAIMPGVSRSGSTIVAGMITGVKPAEAAEFSFLLAIPAIMGAVVLKSRELANIDPTLTGQYAAGIVAAFVFGLAAVSMLMAVIRKGKLDYFAYYCFAAGLIGLYIFL